MGKFLTQEIMWREGANICFYYCQFEKCHTPFLEKYVIMHLSVLSCQLGLC